MNPTASRVLSLHTLAVGTVLALAACTAPMTPSSDTTPSSTPTAPPAATPSPDAADAPVTRQGVAADALLPPEAWEPGSEPRQETAGPAPWRLPESCGAGTPDTSAMLTVTHGDGQAEGAVGVQQVAVFASADAAVAELDRVATRLTGCGADGSTAPTRYVVEPLQVGAQGTGLATDYYGGSADGGDLDGAMGTYAALMRRGTAVTLVTLDGGEGIVGAARERVTAQGYAAWELLCPYDSAGC